jgi:sugar lactone lactonase YvrE
MNRWIKARRRSAAALLTLAGMALAGCASGPVATVGDPKHRPGILVSVGDDCNTPDGVRLDPRTGSIIVACPNFNDKQHVGKLMKITKGNKWEFFSDFPKHPDTGYACPMGMDFGPDGHLYVADNQYFYDKDHKSRLIRIKCDKDGKALGSEVVVEGFKLANAVMWKGDAVFVTDTFFDLADKPGASGAYRITLDEMNKGIVKLARKGQPDPHLILECRTDPVNAPHRKGELAGADGCTFDKDGNFYTGNFGDGTMYKVAFNADGTVKSKGVFVRSPKLTCVDGIFYDAKRNRIYVADSERNAIQVVEMDGKVWTLWENGDTDGADGLLDQPCEPALRGDELIVVNFDMPFPGLKNTKFDKPYTICVIKLD